VALTPGGTHAAQWVIERSTQVVAPAVADTAPEEQARLITLLRAMAATMGL
jgi:hypothetical protein